VFFDGNLPRPIVEWYFLADVSVQPNRSHLQGSGSPRREMGEIGCLETSVRNYNSTLRKIPERTQIASSFFCYPWQRGCHGHLCVMSGTKRSALLVIYGSLSRRFRMHVAASQSMNHYVTLCHIVYYSEG